MAIQVANVVKEYGSQKAVDGISFSIGRGEIAGFLGPNGAGKSTTLKMITGFLPATAGTISVNGYDIQRHLRTVRRQMGYLPEHNPLYPDLYVHEYLRFAGGLYGLSGAALHNRVGQMIEACGLTREQNKKIGALSKGYRQRVGLAQALVHDPPVLILDEPTTGLDPNQIIEIRELIRSVSRDKTVLFSSHIMQEVQALCQRVLIVHRGRLVADHSLEQLLSLPAQNDCISVTFQQPVPAQALHTLPHVLQITELSDRNFQLHTHHPDALRTAVLQLAASQQLPLVSLKREDQSLEAVFRSLTTDTAP